MESLYAGVEVGVHLHAVAVKLKLRRIQQRFIGGEAGNHLVHGLYKVDNVYHGPVRHGGGYVPSHHIGQGRLYVGLGQLLLPCALAVQYVPEALHHYVPRAQHIGKLSHLLCVGYGLVEGLAEVVGYKYGEIGVVAFYVLVRVAVYHSKVVVVVFLAHKSAGILAEGAHLILEGLWIAYELGLIEYLVYPLHYLVSHLDPYPYIHCSRLMSYAVIGAEFFQPVRTPAAGSHNGMLCLYGAALLAVSDIHSLTFLAFEYKVGAFPAKQHLYAVALQILFYGKVKILSLFCSQMPYRAIHKAKSGLYGTLANILYLLGITYSLHPGACSEFKINLIRIIYRFLRNVRSYETWQVASHLAAQRQLTVRKRARAGKARSNVAVWLAVHAAAGLRFRAAAVLYSLPLFHDQYALPASLAQHFKRGEYARRSRADYHYVFFHWQYLRH